MFKNVSIGKKLTLGFGVVLFFLMAVGGISHNAINKASDGFDHYRELTRQTMITFKMQGAPKTCRRGSNKQRKK